MSFEEIMKLEDGSPSECSNAWPASRHQLLHFGLLLFCASLLIFLIGTSQPFFFSHQLTPKTESLQLGREGIYSCRRRDLAQVTRLENRRTSSGLNRSQTHLTLKAVPASRSRSSTVLGVSDWQCVNIFILCIWALRAKPTVLLICICVYWTPPKAP